MAHTSVALGAAILCAGLVNGQAQTAPASKPGQCGVWGQILAPGYQFEDGLSIELLGSGVPRQRAPVVRGNFDFHAVPAGAYEFRVFDGVGRLLFRGAKRLTGKSDHVRLVAPGAGLYSQNAVSLAELSHSTPRQARQAYDAAEKAVVAGEPGQAIQNLEKALAVDPKLIEAHISIAVLFFRAGRKQEALEHIEKAFELDPACVDAGYDFAMMLLLSKDYQQAEAVARRVLNDQPARAEMHGVLAVSLIYQRRNLDEAFDHLRQGAVEFPVARLMAANALIAIGRIPAASNQINDYLQISAHECERGELEAWLAKLSTLEGPPAKATTD